MLLELKTMHLYIYIYKPVCGLFSSLFLNLCEDLRVFGRDVPRAVRDSRNWMSCEAGKEKKKKEEKQKHRKEEP